MERTTKIAIITQYLSHTGLLSKAEEHNGPITSWDTRALDSSLDEVAAEAPNWLIDHFPDETVDIGIDLDAIECQG